MIVTYKHDPVFVHSFNYALGGLRRNLEELKEQNLLLGDVATLRETGYEYNFALRPDETLLQLASRPVLETGQMSDGIDAMVFQHCYQESAVLPYAPNEPDVALRNRYFAAEVMRELEIRPLTLSVFLRQWLRRIRFHFAHRGWAIRFIQGPEHHMCDGGQHAAWSSVQHVARADSPVRPEFGVPPWSRAPWLPAAGNQLLLHRAHCRPVCRNRQASSGND